MADYERIRRKAKLEGRTQRETSRKLHHSRKTIGKALKHASPPGYRRQKPPPRSVLDPFVSIIDAWLEADR